MKKILTERQLI
jgi:hypothetical protein